MSELTTYTLYRKNLASYQENINFYTYIFCLISGIGAIPLLISLMATGVFNKMNWGNIFDVSKFLCITVILSSIVYFLSKKAYQNNSFVTKLFKYILIAASYTNYLGFVKNIPYTNAWAILFFSVFLSALYLEYSTLIYSVVICLLVSTICCYTIPGFLPTENITSELVLRGISIGFGVIGTFLVTWFSKQLLIRSCKSELASKESLDNLQSLLDEAGKISMQLTDSSHMISSLSSEQSASCETVAATSQEVSQGAVESTLSIKESSILISKLMQGISTILDKSTDTVEISKELQQTADDGKSSISDATLKVNGIRSSVETTSHSVKELDIKTKEVDNIVAFIQQISDQTHLLALNASIEAARAGENGKGFAVVASEIRTLADQSQSSLKSITKTLGEISKYSKEVDRLMVTSISEVEDGVRIIDMSNKYYQKISDKLNVTLDCFMEIRELCREQMTQAKTVSEFMDKVDSIASVTAQNIGSVAHSTKENMEASERLQKTAYELDEISHQLMKKISQI